MGTVTIHRRQERYTRTPNGAWTGGGVELSRHPDIPEEKVIDWIFGGGSCCFTTVEWPDGTREWGRVESWGLSVSGPRLEALREAAVGVSIYLPKRT